MIATLVSIALLHWVVLVTPGVNVLLVSQLAASGQQRSAVYASLGITAVTLIWALLAVLGVNALFAAHPTLRLAMQIAGGAYLCYVAIRLWRSGSPSDEASRMELTPLAAFRLGFLTNITNPKSALFFGSVFAAALPANPSSELLIAAVAIAYVNALVFHLLLAVIFSRARVRSVYAKQRATLNRMAGLIVGAMGARLIGNTLNELRLR